jgi:hypothetical protein
VISMSYVFCRPPVSRLCPVEILAHELRLHNSFFDAFCPIVFALEAPTSPPSDQPGVSLLAVTPLIRANKLCIGKYVTPHCSLDLRFRRAS